VKVGDVVEDFELPDEQGVPRKLSDLLAGGPVVLFFYPAAMTAGCTVEACHFRDISAEFAAVGAHPVGISGDSVQRQAQFAAKHSFGYPLLADPEGVVRSQFDVKRGFGIGSTKRVTFVIGQDRRVIEIIKSEVRMNVHADKALEALRQHRT
jgi:thioredoxin-dependent peroxiredoxin